MLQPRRRELGDVDRDAERDRPGDEQREDGGVERAPDEGARAELARDRIPDLGLPELPAELPDRQRGVGVEHPGDPGDQPDQDDAEQTRPDAEAQIVGTGLFHGSTEP